MRPTVFDADVLVQYLRKHKIAPLAELMNALGTEGRRTVFRKLKQLGYRASYSHRGAFYTLERVARFDAQGLWSYRDVWFSTYGTLLSTAESFVEDADTGYFVEELDNVLHVGTKDALRKLVRESRITRTRLSGQFLYCARNPRRREHQLLARRILLAEPGVAGAFPDESVMPDEVRAAIVLFYSLLDEKLRRLYAGLEALKTGRGGDARIAAFLGVDVGTVTRGRLELVRRDVEVDRIRRKGAGRAPLEKKRRKSSRRSNG